MQIVSGVVDDPESFDFARLYLSIKKYYRVLLWTIGTCLLAASIYILVTPKKYTAEAVVLMDRDQLGIAAEISSSTQKGFEASFLESQVEIIKSRSITTSVLRETGNTEYLSAVDMDDIESQEEIILKHIDDLAVRQIGETYVLAIRYSTLSPKEAADIANAYAEAYIRDQMQASQEASQKGSVWLQEKISELRDKSREANFKVNSFRKEHGLFDSGGKLINETQLSELNSRLGESRADTASALARYEYSKKVVETRNIDAATAEALDNDVINTVRSAYLSSKKRYAELSRDLGAEHAAVRGLVAEIKDYEKLIFGEMERIAQSQLSSYSVALAREKALESSLSQLLDVKVGNDALISELAGLLKESETYEKLYEGYLEKFEQIAKSESFPISGTRIITKASPPISNSHPKVLLIIAVALVIGAGVGVVSIIYLDATDGTIRSGQHVRDRIGISFLGYFPLIAFKERRKKSRPSSREAFRFFDPPKIEAVRNPLSISAETLRKSRALIDKRRKSERGCVIGVVSLVPNEGKTTVSVNLALSLAKSGAGCLLVDGDIRNPTIRQEHVEEPLTGLGDVLLKKVGLGDVLLKEASTGLSILSSQGSSAEPVLETINSTIVKKLFSEYVKHFKYIVLDLPPFAASSDALAFSQSIDFYLVVTEWGKTKWDELNLALEQNEIDREKVLGVVINKADVEKLKRFYGFQVYPEYTRSVEYT